MRRPTIPLGVLEQKEILMLTRRNTLQLATSVLAVPFIANIGLAQAYPTRPAKIVVGFPAGGYADVGARLVANVYTERLGQQFIVENRPGAASNIATELVVRAPADGYTLLMLAASAFVNQSVYEKLSF